MAFLGGCVLAIQYYDQTQNGSVLDIGTIASPFKILRS